MILRTGIKRRLQALTLIEILAVIVLIAIVTGTAVSSFRGTTSRLRSLSQNMIRDIQGAYHQSLRRGDVFKLEFYPEENTYRLLRFEFPPPAPPEEDREAFREWEDAERERLDELRRLGVRERRNLTALERARYVLIEERRWPDNIALSDFQREDSNPLDPDAPFILFFPTGEVDPSLIVFEDQSSGRVISLMTERYGGRVRTFTRALSLEEWEEERMRWDDEIN